MVLEQDIGSAVEQPTGDVLFSIRDGSRLVPCRVTAEALLHLTGGSYRTATLAFDAVRLPIEIVASTKYACGLVDDDGSVTVWPADLG